jgi:AcrR family transcriptional regulator
MKSSGIKWEPKQNGIFYSGTISDMPQESEVPAPLSGRRRQAAVNDGRILEAAREVFIADPGAPITAVAHRAGVGISALYSRYPSKDDLLRKLCGDGLALVVSIVESALADDRDEWTVFSGFMDKMVEAGTSSLTLALAGKFEPSQELFALAGRANELMVELFERVKDVLRPGLDVNDVSLVFEQLAAIKLGGPERGAQLRNRYLAVVLDGMRADAGLTLPGTPPTWQEISTRWAATGSRTGTRHPA